VCRDFSPRDGTQMQSNFTDHKKALPNKSIAYSFYVSSFALKLKCIPNDCLKV
jgi:hypothetical protein